MKRMYSRIALSILALVSILMIPYGFTKEARLETVYEMPESGLTVVKSISQEVPIEHPDFVKEPYVPVIPEGDNIASQGKAEASSFVQAYTPRKTIDEKTGGASYWEALPDSYPNTLTIDLGTIEPIHAVRVMLNPDSIWGARDQSFSVRIGTAEEALTVLIPEAKYTFDPDYGNEVLLEFDTIEAQFVQLLFTSNTGASGAQVAEVQIFRGRF